MTQQVTIDRVQARFRVPAHIEGTRHRLDRIVQNALSNPLEDALSRLGISSDELFCVRRLHVPVTFNLAQSDTYLRDTWIEELVSRLEALQDSGGIVRYDSRSHALIAAARSLASGDSSRAWALRQLGMWPSSSGASAAETTEAVVAALCADPNSIVPVFRELAAQPTEFVRFEAMVSRAQWHRLAEAAVAVHGGRAEVLSEFPAPDGLPLDATRRPKAGEAKRADTQARRLLGQSRIGKAAAELGQPTAPVALAALVIAEVSPPALSTRTGELPHLIDTLRRLIASGDHASPEEQSETKPVRTPDGVEDPEQHERTGGSQLESNHVNVSAVASETRTDPPVITPIALAPYATDPETHSDVTARAETRLADRAASSTTRRTGTTSYGGLMYAVHIVDELKLWEEIASESGLAHRPFRFLLNALACALAPVESSDPVALAFAGLSPDDDASFRDEDPLSEEERTRIRFHARRICRRMRQRMQWAGRKSVVNRVFCESAEILADPGWIEVRFPMESISIDIRKSGLDLNPDFVPWLGVIVRFSYV